MMRRRAPFSFCFSLLSYRYMHSMISVHVLTYRYNTFCRPSCEETHKQTQHTKTQTQHISASTVAEAAAAAEAVGAGAGAAEAAPARQQPAIRRRALNRQRALALHQGRFGRHNGRRAASSWPTADGPGSPLTSSHRPRTRSRRSSTPSPPATYPKRVYMPKV